MTRSRLRYFIGLVLGIAFIGLMLWIYSAYQRDVQRAKSRVAHGSRMVQTACGPIEFASVGSGPAILVVHGAGGGFDQGLDFGEQLANDGFRVISMSRFGYLRTPLPADASASAQADAHACLLDALKIPYTAIIGASAGAPSAMQFALRYPSRCTAMVLLVPAAYVPRLDNAPPMKTPAWTEFLFNTALTSDFVFWAAIRLAGSTVTQAILATPPDVIKRATPDEQARVAKMLDHILPVSQRRLGLLNDAKVTSTLGRYALERIIVPTLAISMEDDLFGTYDGAKYSAQHLPHARFIGYPSGGHLWVGHHQEIMAEISRFLHEQRSPEQ